MAQAVMNHFKLHGIPQAEPRTGNEAIQKFVPQLRNEVSMAWRTGASKYFFSGALARVSTSMSASSAHFAPVSALFA
jgi:hypothetical protein